MTVVIKNEDDASQQLSASGFAEAWEALFLQCPWAAPTQSLGFVTTWYEVYRERFSPVLVSETSPDGTLTGALPLAISRDNGQLVVAGAHQAEYRSWMSLPTDGGAFITQALLAIRHAFPRRTLVLEYLPPETPLDFLAANKTLMRCCRVKRCRCPLLVLDERELANSLGKKRYRTRINQLKALGEMTFERITTASEAEPFMAEIMTQCDLRQGAVHDSLPFRDDPLKKKFHTALLDKSDLLHCTVLKVGSSVLSAHLGLIDRKRHRVLLGVYSHSVPLARHSLGTLHILMLGAQLAKEGIAVLDLTPPGGDYKERFASTHEEVSRLTMYGDRKQFWYAGFKTTALASAKKAFEVLGLPGSSLMAALGKAQRMARLGLLGNLKRLRWHRRPMRLYRYDFAATEPGDADAVMSRDRLGDLLAFEAKRTWSIDRQGFLADACMRLEKGHHCYTHIDRDSLMHCAWLVERSEDALVSDLHPGYQIPEGSALLVDCTGSQQTRETGLFESCVKQMLHDARLVSGTQYAFVSVLANDTPTMRSIEQLGFVYQGSPGRG